MVMEMESNYFKKYASNHYSGYIDYQDLGAIVQRLLNKLPSVINFNGSDEQYFDNLVSFRKGIIEDLKPALKKAHDLVCSPSECENLKEMVNCEECKTMINSLCQGPSVCKGDRERRIAVETAQVDATAVKLTNIAMGIAVIAGFIVFVLLVAIALIYTYYTRKEIALFTVETEEMEEV
ncbi:uncharacterized protein LOC116412291 isoform X2 [Xenopus tropicalis]|nr:uncharacterized protein LOC116412291 isoform X2 [Xenopus tropicalis]